MNKIQENLPYIRKQLGMQQQEFAKYLGVSNTSLSMWEHGKLGMRLSRQKQIMDICKRFGIQL